MLTHFDALDFWSAARQNKTMVSVPYSDRHTFCFVLVVSILLILFDRRFLNVTARTIMSIFNSAYNLHLFLTLPNLERLELLRDLAIDQVLLLFRSHLRSLHSGARLSTSVMRLSLVLLHSSLEEWIVCNRLLLLATLRLLV